MWYNFIMVKILALDISTKSSGYCVIENGKVKDYGTITSDEKDFLDRGQYMAEFIRLLCEKYGTFDYAYIEELKVISNQRTLEMLGIVQGMIIRELKNSDVSLVPPTVWRKPYGLNGKRAEAKKKAIAICEDKGFTVHNDDEAEAILLGLYAVDSLG
jgi:Holliday junction resolvasome RuvABC endonuclease subunit